MAIIFELSAECFKQAIALGHFMNRFAEVPYDS